MESRWEGYSSVKYCKRVIGKELWRRRMTFTKLHSTTFHYLPPIRIFLRIIGIVLGSGRRCRKGFALNLESFLFPIFIGVAESKWEVCSAITRISKSQRNLSWNVWVLHTMEQSCSTCYHLKWGKPKTQIPSKLWWKIGYGKTSLHISHLNIIWYKFSLSSAVL